MAFSRFAPTWEVKDLASLQSAYGVPCAQGESYSETMQLAGRIVGLCVAGILLVLTVSFGAVELDLLPAQVLRFVPHAIALIIAGAIVASVGRRRREAPNQQEEE